MIVIGLDVHKYSLTAAAVDALGRSLGEIRGPVDEQVIEWGRSLGEECLWAVEDCRHVRRGIERALLAHGERLVGVPPRLTVPQRRRRRTRGRSDAIDALAIARAALQEPSLDGPRPGARVLHELKRLVDHRDDLVDERRRAQQRLRWHLHELDPNLAVPLGALDRAVWLERLTRQLARREQTIQGRLSRELLGRCKALTRSLLTLDRELEQHAQTLAPRLLEIPACGPLSSAKLLCEIAPIARFRTDAQLARHAGVAPLDASSGKNQRHRLDRGGNGQLNCALHRIAVTEGRVHPPARAYLERKQNEGKTRREAIRCLKRQLARTVYTTLKNEPLLT